MCEVTFQPQVGSSLLHNLKHFIQFYHDCLEKMSLIVHTIYRTFPCLINEISKHSGSLIGYYLNILCLLINYFINKPTSTQTTNGRPKKSYSLKLFLGAITSIISVSVHFTLIARRS